MFFGEFLGMPWQCSRPDSSGLRNVPLNYFFRVCHSANNAVLNSSFLVPRSQSIIPPKRPRAPHHVRREVVAIGGAREDLIELDQDVDAASALADVVGDRAALVAGVREERARHELLIHEAELMRPGSGGFARRCGWPHTAWPAGSAALRGRGGPNMHRRWPRRNSGRGGAHTRWAII